MAPRILDQNGSPIYGPGKYSRQYAVENGVAGYSKTLEAAQKDQRVMGCLLYTSPSPRDQRGSRMPASA